MRRALPLLLTTLATRIAWVLAYATEPRSDFAYYLQVGRNIADGLGFTYDGGPTAMSGPGAPMLAAIAWWLGGPGWVCVLNLAIGVALVWGVVVLARRHFPEPVPWVAGWLVALHPDLIAFTALPSTDLPYTTALIWGMAGAGAAWLVAVLFRPQAVLLGWVWSLATSRWAGFVGVAVGAGLVLAMHHHRLGVLALTTTGGANLWAGITGTIPPLPYGQNEVVWSATYMVAAWELIRTDPLGFFALMPYKLVQALSGSGTAILHSDAPSGWVKVATGYQWVLYSLAVCGAWVRRPPREFWVVGLATLALNLVFQSSWRYFLPAVPLVAIVAAVGVVWGWMPGRMGVALRAWRRA